MSIRSAAIAGFGLAVLLAMGSALAEEVVEIETRPGQTVRALLLRPETPTASVILLAGGHGNLDIAEDGRLRWGRLNQLVRTRALYADAGFLTLVPDIAPDFKSGMSATRGYRFSPEHAQDIAALIAYLRTQASPVHLIGTSRAALSVANAAARLSPPLAPDTIVITAGLLMHVDVGQPSVQTHVPGFARIALPTLLVSHAEDRCAYSLAPQAEEFARLLERARPVDHMVLKGGEEGEGTPCEASSRHGFVGLDAEVVAGIARWLKARSP